MKAVTYLVFILPTLTFSAKIFGIFTVPSISHQKSFLNLAKELSLRGHEVTIATTNPFKDKSLVNLTEIDISFLYKSFGKRGGLEKLLSSNSLWDITFTLRNIFDLTAVEVFENRDVQHLLETKQTFDAVIVETHNPIYFAFGPKFSAPVISMSSLGAPLDMHDSVGNPSHPFLAPEIFMPYSGSADIPFMQRLGALWYHIWYKPLYYWSFIPQRDKIIRRYLGENIPSLVEIQSGVSLVLVTVNPIMDTVRPNIPTVISVEKLHIDKPKPLPKHLKEYLDASTKGVIYFSLGSNLQSAQLGNKTLEKITNALGKVPFNILWKFEKDEFPKKPTNIFIQKWLPQQDVLGHSNMKAFITQCGLQSIEEAISEEVPMVGLPFVGDQSKNCEKLDKWKMGLKLDLKEMSSEDFAQAIIEVATNPSFKNNIRKVKSIINDQPLTGIEKAVWWVEYVIRHNGTEHLRYPGADMPLYKYFFVDVVCVIFLAFLLIIFILRKIFFKIANILKTKKLKTQ